MRILANGSNTRAVARFYFHVYNHVVTMDEEGQDLADAGAAMREAIRSARALICEDIRNGGVDLRHRIEVEDDKGAPVLSLAYRDAFVLKS